MPKKTTLDISPDKCNRLDLAQAVKFRFVNGLTEPEIAKHFKVSKQAVNERLMPFRKLLAGEGLLKVFDSNYDRILTNVSMLLLTDLLDPKKREKASLNNVAFAFTQINQALRLHRGESTANVSFAEMIQEAEKTKANKAPESSLKSQTIDVTPDKEGKV